MERQDKRPQHKHLPQGLGVAQYVPYQSLTTNTMGTQGQTGTQQNMFTPGQQQLQGNLGNLWQSFLGGNIPSSFTNPAAATNAYQSNFQTQVAPGLAAQYGAGSPQLASQNALGLAQLQGNLYNTGVNNFMNAMGGGTNYALGMPTGGQTAQQGQQVGTQQQTSGINDLAFLAQLLMGATSPSDERLKKDIKPIDKEKAVEQIKKLRSVEFKWREEFNMEKGLQLGFIAQEVEQIIPEAVHPGDAGDVYLLNKETIIPVLVAAVQELSERLETLEKDK